MKNGKTPVEDRITVEMVTARSTQGTSNGNPNTTIMAGRGCNFIVQKGQLEN